MVIKILENDDNEDTIILNKICKHKNQQSYVITPNNSYICIWCCKKCWKNRKKLIKDYKDKIEYWNNNPPIF